MEELQIKQEFGKYYVVADLDVEQNEEYLVRMITDNNIDGHLHCHVSYNGLKRCLMYDVTNMISLSECFSNKYIEMSCLKELFEDIQKIYTNGSRHLLDERYYYLDPKFIFMNMENNKISLLYIPRNINGEGNIYHNLADFFLQRINRKDDSCVQIAYQFYRMSCAETFSISMFLNVIEKETIMQKKKSQNEFKSESVPEIIAEEEEEKKDEHEDVGLTVPIIVALMTIIVLATYLLIFKSTVYKVYVLIGLIFLSICSVILWVKAIYQHFISKQEDDIVITLNPVTVDQYWGDEETVVIQENTAVIKENNRDVEGGLRLEWKEKGTIKKYGIKSFPIIIGKMKDEVDCLIDDESISRLHAKIIKRNGEWIIFDLNSTNHTYIDGQQLQAGEQKQIFKDSNIMLGNVVVRIVSN